MAKEEGEEMTRYARIKGGKELKKWHEGKALTRKEAMLTKCYECNGEEESGADCEVAGCLLYAYHPHKGRTVGKNAVE